jgi:hypothetical protein
LEIMMDLQTLIIIVVIFLLLGGGAGTVGDAGFRLGLG